VAETADPLRRRRNPDPLDGADLGVAPRRQPHAQRTHRLGWFVASQIAFGVAAGRVVSRSAKIATLQSESFLVRAGVEFARGKDGLS